MPKRLKSNVPTEELTYPCPRCGTYSLPYMHSRDGYAYMRCPKCFTQYRTSTAVSANFRKFCSKVARKNNRSPTYYTSSEEAVKKYLESKGLIEGLDFFHNARVKDGEIPEAERKGKAKWKYYWFDFVIPSKKLIIEVDPEVWHRLWGRQKSDERKKEFVEKLGWKLVSLNTEAVQKLNRTQKDSTKRPDVCKELDKLFNNLQKGEKENKESEEE